MNHRDFVKSRNYPQLRGEVHVDSSNNSKCQGARYMSEIFDKDESKYITAWNVKLQNDSFANPCGLIAKSFFNDSYTLYDPNGQEITINETDIAQEYDKKYMFKRNVNYTSLQWIDVENGNKLI
jgi:hypothetical protein